MEFSKYEIELLGQALSYAIMYANTEQETAEFGILKVKVESEIAKLKQNDGIKCKRCGKKLDHHAIKETGLCTPCFTSNA